MSKVAKKEKDFRVDYFGAKLKDKITYILIEVIENKMVLQADKFSEIGPNIEDAFKMTFEDIEEIKTSIITEEFVIIEVKSRV